MLPVVMDSPMMGTSTDLMSTVPADAAAGAAATSSDAGAAAAAPVGAAAEVSTL